MATTNTYIIGRTRYRVTAALVQVELPNGTVRQLGYGSVLPAATPPGVIRLLLGKGMIGPLDTPADTTAKPPTQAKEGK